MFQNMEVVQSEKLHQMQMLPPLLEQEVEVPIMVKGHQLRLTGLMV